MTAPDLLAPLAGYYADKIARHGQTPQGVDWNGEQGQWLRFEQLVRVADGLAAPSINDLGCGYGALLDFLVARGREADYLGVDVAAPMVAAARERHAGRANARFIEAARPDRVADVGLASGIFSVRLNTPDEAWFAHIVATLDVLHETSRAGFAFNCLTSYSDADKMRPDLYYADPCRLFDLCKRRYARQVALLHDYGLWEFTLIVRQ